MMTPNLSLKIYCGAPAQTCFQSSAPARDRPVKSKPATRTIATQTTMPHPSQEEEYSKIRRQIAEQISNEGLNFLMADLKIGSFPIGLLKSLAQKYTGTEEHIHRYSYMNREDLINSLVQRGFKR